MSSFEILAQSDRCINLADCVLRGQCKEVFPIGQLFGPQVIPVASGNRVRYESRGPKASCQSLLRLFGKRMTRSEEHTSELQSLMSISYTVFVLNKKRKLNMHCSFVFLILH